MLKNQEDKVVCQNKKVYHDYYILEEFECGIVLTGTEIKSIRLGKVNIQDSYCYVKNGEMLVMGMHISMYDKGNIFNHQPDAIRKLLLNKKEIVRLSSKTVKDGFTIVPLRVVLRHGLAKVDIGVAKGKKLYDKREDMKEKEATKEVHNERSY